MGPQTSSHKQEVANPAAAMSLITSHNQHIPPPTPLSAKEFWGEATGLGVRDRFGEWVKVAKFVMVK
jgi:hypothetical protein